MVLKRENNRAGELEISAVAGDGKSEGGNGATRLRIQESSRVSSESWLTTTGMGLKRDFKCFEPWGRQV